MSASESRSEYEPRLSEVMTNRSGDVAPPTPVKAPEKSKAQKKREFDEFMRQQAIKLANWEEYLERARCQFTKQLA